MRSLFGSSRAVPAHSVRTSLDGFCETRPERVERYRSTLADIAADEVLSSRLPSDLPANLHRVIEAWVQATEQPAG
jgi:hypothetical protein